MRLLLLSINILITVIKRRHMADSKTLLDFARRPTRLINGWAIYGGADGVTNYVRLCNVVGLKVSDAEVTLRLSNGQFVTTTDPLVKVLADLAAAECC